MRVGLIYMRDAEAKYDKWTARVTRSPVGKAEQLKKWFWRSQAQNKNVP